MILTSDLIANFLTLEAELVIGFTFAAILIELTPGPNMTYLALVAASKGRALGFSTVGGVALGLSVIGIAAALGITTIIQNSSLLYQALRWSGIVFLLYLAYDGWIGEKPNEVGTENVSTSLKQFQRGLITNLLNPKAAAFYVTVLPTFLPESPSLWSSLQLTAIYVLVATLIHVAIVIMAGSLAPMLKHPEKEQFARRVFSILLAGVAIWFALSTQK